MSNEERESSLHTHAPRGRIHGAMVGHAAGDALGWPQELPSSNRKGRETLEPTSGFRAWQRRAANRFLPHEEAFEAGAYSDDTQLLLAVARSRIVGGRRWWSYFTRTELPLWTLYERGGGGATKRAASHWARQTPPWKANSQNDVSRYFAAGGNGVAMRVLPHAIIHADSDDPLPLMHDVLLDGAATHGHPRALVGAATYAYTAWSLLRTDHTLAYGELFDLLLDRQEVWGLAPSADYAKTDWLESAQAVTGVGYQTLWSEAVEEMANLLHLGKRGLNEGALADDREMLETLGALGSAKGSGTVSTASVIYLCSRFAARPLQAVVVAAFSQGADTDTLAAMSGGLLGCLAGSDWQPREWTEVQDYQYICRLADRLTPDRRTGDLPSRAKTISLQGLKSLRVAIQEHQSEQLVLDGIRQARIVRTISLETSSPAVRAEEIEIVADDGQRLFVKVLSKGQTVPSGELKDRSRRKAPNDAKQPSLWRPIDGSAVIVGLTHIVDDLARMVEFFESMLGLYPTSSGEDHVQYGPLRLTRAEPAVGTVKSPEKRSEVEIHVHVVDFEKVLERVSQSGLTTTPGRALAIEQRQFRCADPESNTVVVTG